jgi:DNA-binding response OmpR family regulator
MSEASGFSTSGSRNSPATTGQLDSHALRILVVEDHADTASAIRMVLEAGGHGVQVAGTIAAARKLADEITHQHAIDLVICDIGLPDGTGLDLMRHLKSRHNLAGICLSGYASEADINHSAAAGFLAHLTKPVDLDELEAAVVRISRHRHNPTARV